ncbi:RNA polymerase sigma (70) factor [Planomonospora sphaerica]|uniref:RNA polymerase sigma (70) factor n=1 Tax=Planomonospora sphaerica TaxID=161355 RepID=A0A171DP51_9ACTN|nr:CU044_5270 family protein [Planomonospora sphaerica]GAT70835.1 RNA polymerase sigma (70) factor [Planomonospora sphaerica]
MNAIPPRPAGPGEHPEPSGPLPVPAVPDLSADRHHVLREHLMSEIRTARESERSPARRRPLLRFYLPLTAVAAAACATALVVGGVVPGVPGGPGGSVSGGGTAAGAGGTGATPRSTAATVVELGTASSDGVVRQLERISLAAAKRTAQVRADQFAYQRRMQAGSIPALERTMPGEGPMVLTPMAHRQIWIPQDPRGNHGLIIENGVSEDWDLTATGNPYAYGLLAAYPTDPDELLTKIYAGLGSGLHDGTTRDQQAFNAVGEILDGAVLPPDLGAALYRAVAKIPGVVLVDRAQDAAGRTGIAVAREDDGARTEWIFDPETLEYLGERKVQVKATRWLRPGTLLSTSAVLESAIVDGKGEVPGTRS